MTTEHFPNSINNKSDLTYSHGGSVRNSNRRRTPGQGGGPLGKTRRQTRVSLRSSSNRLSRQRRRLGALFFGCRSRPARASFSIFAPTASRPSGLSRPQLCLSASSLIILIQPEAIMGASFQLSFAAVAALVAVYEARMGAAAQGHEEMYRSAARPVVGSGKRIALDTVKLHLWRGPLGLLFATFCATSATASFMAYNFHELSPYVLIGNPLTLTVIEIFAVPGALLGTLLYPLGLDAFVWRYVGLGIDGVMWAARTIGSFSGSTLHLPAFAPWAIVFLSLAVLSSVLWRTAMLRATALPLLGIGLFGAAAGPSFDMAVAPLGDAVAYRAADGKLAVIGRSRNVFSTEQWLRADADGRQATEALTKTGCDKLGCVGTLASGQVIALIFDRAAFAEDCTRADIIVTPLFAPMGCAAGTVIDRDKLKQTGALTLSFAKDGVQLRGVRAADEDRPWSPAPKRGWGRSAPPPAAKAEAAQAAGEEPEFTEDNEDSPLE